MNNMWKLLIRNKISPNQFYLLWAIKDKVTTPILNTELELKYLKRSGWILEDSSISADGKKLLKEVEAYFKIAKKKTNTQLMGTDFKENLETYNNAFPNRKLPSGKAARTALGNLEPAFRWFFLNYDYSWETILKATNQYLDEKEADNWNYTSTSQYFVRKQQVDKTWISMLADFCMHVENGGTENDNNHFSEKIYE